jgi:hypothetical protein
VASTPSESAPQRRKATPSSRSRRSIRATAGKEREARSAPAVAPSEASAAIAAVRRFLDGYLPYSYGRADADAIRSAAATLVRALAAAPPRVPAAFARARPRLISVRADAATGDGKVGVLAVVEDGRRRYVVPLTVREDGGRWLVTEISG